MEDNLYAPPKAKLSDVSPLSAATQRGTPPRAVIIAIGIVLLSAVVGFVRQLIIFQQTDATVLGVGLVVGSGIMYVWLRALYRGRNWVRWLGLAKVTLVWGLTFSHRGVVGVSIGLAHDLFIVQSIAQTAAMILLFLPPSNQWFTRGRHN